MNSCTPAAAVPDGEVRTTTARDLVRNYRDEPGPADLAYTGQVVRVSLRTFDRQPDGSLVWKVLYRPDLPPALVVRFAPDSAPGKLDAPVWVEGTCRGRADDDLDRGSPGYRFRVLITGARVVPPPS